MKLEDLQVEIQKIEDEILSTIKKLVTNFEESIRIIFDNNPKLQLVQIAGYTPYFND